jgi:hypothetical protein
MAGNAQDRASAAEYLEWKKRAASFQALEAFRPGRTLNLAIGDAPEIVTARQVTRGTRTPPMFPPIGGVFWGAIGGWIADALIRKREIIYLAPGRK